MTTVLETAARRRAHDTRQRAVEALRRLDAAGAPVTFISVARAAGVSRSWLYRHADLRAEIDRLRVSSFTATVAVPSAQRATAESLRRRLETTMAEITRLKAENHQLRELVAQRLGQQRADGLT